MKALVIGGTSNLGKSIVGDLIKDNYEVIFTYSNNITAANLLDEKYNTTSYKVDIRDEADVISLFNHISGIDLLVIVSGLFSVSPQSELEITDFDKVIDLNIKGTFLVIKHAINKMKESSSIVLVSSTNAFHPGFGNTAHYDASKGFIVSYTKSLASELAPKKIRVNSVAPGLIEAEYLHNKDNPVLNMFLERALIKETVKAQDVSSTVSFLANNKAIDGQTIIIDCGYLNG